VTIIFLLELHSDNKKPDPVSDENISALKSTLVNLPEASELFLFSRAEGGHDPFLKDEYPPLLVMLAKYQGIDSLQKSIASAEFELICNQLISLPHEGLYLLQEALQLEAYLSCATREKHAELSYLVNYQRPADNETEFLQYYRDHHPDILLNFPNIRRVELGTPIEWTPAKNIEVANRMLYCEVSFDDINMLNQALNSNVRKELRKDYELFPPFSGAVTHFPMHRQVIV
jgi:uncharacterized protein (TIGR02118 family)